MRLNGESMIRTTRKYIDRTFAVQCEKIIRCRKGKSNADFTTLKEARAVILTAANMAVATGAIEIEEYDEIAKCVYMEEE